MPLDEDAFMTFMDHLAGPKGSPQLACATCSEAACSEDLCCWGYTLWEATLADFRDKSLEGN